MAKHLIIGCGYLGSQLARLWRAQGHHVLATSRHPGDRPDLAALGVEVIGCDVLDPVSLRGLGGLGQVDAVAHAVALDRTSGQTMRAVYVDGLANLVRALPRPSQFVYVSSSGVYGQAAGEWVDEDSATQPAEESGRIVLEAENVLQAELPDAMILRFAGIYGQGRLLRQKTIEAGEPIVAAADRWLNLIHVVDGARAIIGITEQGRPGRVYNVCDGQPLPRRDFYAELARVLGAPPPRFAPSTGPDLPPHERANRRVSNRRLVQELSFAFQYPSYREGIAASLR